MEWDKTSAFERSEASPGRPYQSVFGFSEVVTDTQYQIAGLEEGQPYWVSARAHKEAYRLTK